MSDPEESERRRIERERDMKLIVGVLIPVAITFFVLLLIPVAIFFFVLLLLAHFLQ